MTLRLFVRSLQDVRAELRAEYVWDGEAGQYRLELVDYDEHVRGLKTALAKERELNRSLRSKSAVTADGAAALAAFGRDGRRKPISL